MEYIENMDAGHRRGMGMLIDLDLVTLIVLEYFLDIHAEVPGNPEGEFETGYILPLLDRQDRLAGDPDHLRQVLLRHVVHGAEHLDLILHRSPIPRISG